MGLASYIGMFYIPLLYAFCFGGLTYVLVKSLREASDSYAGTYTEDTARQFEDLFLFIPPKRLLEISRIAALTGAWGG